MLNLTHFTSLPTVELCTVAPIPPEVWKWLRMRGAVHINVQRGK